MRECEQRAVDLLSRAAPEKLAQEHAARKEYQATVEGKRAAGLRGHAHRLAAQETSLREQAGLGQGRGRWLEGRRARLEAQEQGLAEVARGFGDAEAQGLEKTSKRWRCARRRTSAATPGGGPDPASRGPVD